MTTGGLPGASGVARWGVAIGRLYAPLAAASIGMVPIVWATARGDAPATIAMIGLLAEAALLLVLRGLDRFTSPGPLGASIALHALLGGGTTALGYFLGPHSGLAGFLSALLVLIGLSAGGPGVQRKAWVAGTSVAVGQAVLVGLIAGGAVPDRSMFPLLPSGLPVWKVVAMHAAVQVVYLGAFLTGGTIARRYAALVRAADDATRAAIQREALVAEARAEHQRALHAGGYGVFAGQRIGGYRLRGLIGRGGMGEVYDGVGDDGVAAAVKVMRGDRLGDPDAAARLQREAAALARVDSPYVARLYATGGAEHELPFVAMERLDGDSLEALARPGRPLDRAALAELIEHATRALEAVHAAGLVHRDLSPGNLVRVTEDDGRRWKLVDFGIAAPPGGARDHAPMGTLRYIAPEQLAGGDVDGRADVHGLGLCLYLGATGRAPWDQDTREALCTAVAGALPVAPSALAAVGADLERVIRIAIAKAPADRFADAGALRTAALAALAGELPDDVRAHADRLIAAQPWATRPAAAAAAHTSGDDVATLADGAGSPSWTGAAEDALVPTRTRDGAREPGGAAASSDASSDVDLGTSLPPPSPWDRAYVAKMIQACWGLLGLSAGGGLLLLAIAARTTPLVIAWGCIAGVAAVAVAVLRETRRAGLAAAHRWLWGLLPLLAIGPSYFFGVTSAFSAVVGAFVFQTGLLTRASTRASFDSAGAPAPAFAQDDRFFDGRPGVPWFELQMLIGTVIAQSATFAAIMVGAIDDAGLYPVRVPDAPGWELWGSLAGVQAVYVGAMVIGWGIDHRFQVQIRTADAAARAGARAQALLETARRELRRALGEAGPGLFTGHLIGNFRLGTLVGRGGMGEVYDATHAATGRRAAVKLLRTDRLGDRRTLERFLREAVALSRLDSDHVARVFEVGGLDGELPHIAMEFLDGKDLGALLRDGPGLDRAGVIALIVDVTRGLTAAHEAGVVHRDVKPRNLVRVTGARGPLWKVVDFGVAKLVDHGAGTTGVAIVGTPAYMAPEQAAGRGVDARTDLYALGLVVYRLVVGRAAFAGDAVPAGGEPLDPRSIADLGEDLELALRIALAPEPADRFATAAELGAAFVDAFADRLSPGLRTRGRALCERHPWRAA